MLTCVINKYILIINYFISLSLFAVQSTNSEATNMLIHCQKCQIQLPKHKFRYHLRTNIHKTNCLLKTEFNNIEIIATAFRNRIVTYRLNPTQEVEYLTPEAFLCEKQSDIIKVIELLLMKHDCIKINFELFTHFSLPKKNELQLKSFNTKYEVVYRSTDLNELYETVIEKLKHKFIEFQHCESGWSYFGMSHLEINVNKYCPMRGGSYIPLPTKIQNTKSCLNIQNNDKHCFLWSIIAALFPSRKNVCRVNSYPHYSSILNTEGMSFPPSVNDIKLFEKNNPNISINVYGLNKCNVVTGPLYMTKSKKKKKHHINLLYFEQRDKGHYCLIKNLVRLVRRQISHHKGMTYFCDTCLQFFTKEQKYNSHHCSQVLTVLPEKHTCIQFEHFERKQKINFVIYADFESMLINCDTMGSKNTNNLKQHIPTCFAYYVCCSYDSSLNKYVTYRGADCVEIFIKWLFHDIQNIHNILSENNQMKPMTNDQKHDYENATKCHICNQFLFGDKVRDHDHITSEYRGAAHSHCNLRYKVCAFIPVVFHNLAGYDCHLFIKELAKYKGSIRVIPKSKEKYTSIIKFIDSENKSQTIQIKFIDSFQFLSSSLDNLSKSLTQDDFHNLTKEFESNEEKIHLLIHKGIYPYDYVDSWSKYEENKLPSKNSFYNMLKSEHITDHEYAHAQAVWSEFKIKTLGEYTDLYLKCDVLLLCDIFEHFRNMSLKHYSLDPAYYVYAPNLSWDAMLLCTRIRLELINDLDMYQMLEKGIRGGLAQCSLRNAKANNKYCPNFDDLKPSSYLVYLDCNNLYGYAMRQKMPVSDFVFLCEDTIRT